MRTKYIIVKITKAQNKDAIKNMWGRGWREGSAGKSSYCLSRGF